MFNVIFLKSNFRMCVTLCDKQDSIDCNTDFTRTLKTVGFEFFVFDFLLKNTFEKNMNYLKNKCLITFFIYWILTARNIIKFNIATSIHFQLFLNYRTCHTVQIKSGNYLQHISPLFFFICCYTIQTGRYNIIYPE